jgi:type I restriction enzyme, S subunit
MIGTIGLIYLEQSQTVDYAIKNIGLFKTSQNLDWCCYTYLWLRSSFLWLRSSLGQDFIHEHRSGSTQEYISLGSLRNIVFYAPPFGKLNDFNAIISPIVTKKKANINQIRTLETLRDTLLPKLMSGEVRVKLHE